MKDHALTIVPDGMVITRCPTRVAYGAHKPRIGPRGDAPTTSHAAQSARTIFANGPHHGVRALAARGWK